MDLDPKELNEFIQQGGKIVMHNDEIVLVKESPLGSALGNEKENSSLIYENIHDLYDSLLEYTIQASVPILNSSSLGNFEEFLFTHVPNFKPR